MPCEGTRWQAGRRGATNCEVRANDVENCLSGPNRSFNDYDSTSKHNKRIILHTMNKN